MHLAFISSGLNRLRCSVYLVLAVVVLSTRPSSASPNDSTTIVVVGTVHNKTDNFTVRTLCDIMERVKPDLILVELDSSFLTPSMSIKPEFLRISLENEAVAQYQKDHGVPIRPYDIEGRNKIYQSHNYFKLQQDLSKALNQAFHDNLLTGESAIVLEAIDRFDDIGRSFGSESARILNSNPCDVAMESKQFYAGDGMVRIVSSVPLLKQFEEFAVFRRDFWIQRNEAMVANILYWASLQHHRTILVLCGYEHRYYLRHGLKSHRGPDAFILREYWSY
jgi:hypothetical protein